MSVFTRIIFCLSVPHGQKQRFEDPCWAAHQHVAWSLCWWEEVQQLLRGKLQCLCWNGTVALLTFIWFKLCYICFVWNIALKLTFHSMRTRPMYLGSGELPAWWVAINSQMWLERWNSNKSVFFRPVGGNGRRTGLLILSDRKFRKLTSSYTLT